MVSRGNKIIEKYIVDLICAFYITEKNYGNGTCVCENENSEQVHVDTVIHTVGQGKILFWNDGFRLIFIFFVKIKT